MSEIQRVRKVVNWLIFSEFADNDTDLAEKLDYTKSSFSQILNGKVNLSDKFINALCSCDENINKVWIKTGEGSLLKSTETSLQVDNEPTKSYVTGRPFYDVDFTLGIEQIDNNISLHPAFNIDFKPANRDGVIWFRGKGDSMLGEINSGDYVALEEVLDFSWFPLGRNYGIVTKNDFRTIKKIVKGSNDDEYILISSNPDKESHPNQPLPKNLIKKLFKVIYIIRDLDE